MSALTEDMGTCYFAKHCQHTGKFYCNKKQCWDIEVHHVFNAYNRKRSEKYGYVVPLAREIHYGHSSPRWEEIDTILKQTAQKHFETYIGTREQFIKEFGRNYL